MIIVYFNRGYTCIIYHLFNIAHCIAGGMLVLLLLFDRLIISVFKNTDFFK